MNINTDLSKLIPHLYFQETFGIDTTLINRLLTEALASGGHFAECYFEYRQDNSIHMEEDLIKSSSESNAIGLGVRVLQGDQTGYAYTNQMDEAAMRKAARTAGAIAKAKSQQAVPITLKTNSFQIYDLNQPVSFEPLDSKIALVQTAYHAALNYHPAVQKVQASLGDSIQVILIANSLGLLAGDVRPQVRLSVSTMAEKNKLKTTGFNSNGGRVGMQFYADSTDPAQIGKNSAEEAIILLDAQDAPAGEQTVVLGAGQSGVMIHEAVGHPLEADSNRKKSSIMWDKMHTMVANPLVTIYDDPTLPYLRGSYNLDDEGTTPEKTMLIEKGKLTGLLSDKLSADVMHQKLTGHGRREGYYSNPIPRMANTILAQGESDPEEIIRSVDYGFYAKSFQGGQVQDSGKFTFSVNLGYLIEKGKLTTPLRNATLIGTNVEVLQNINMVGTDMGYFLGTCGKEGQSVPVTAGTPTLKVSKMTVGGRQ